MKKTLFSTAGIILLSALSLNAQAAYISNINIDGGFDIYGFSVLPGLDPDTNPLSYTIDLYDIAGSAEYNLPPLGANVDWYATGGAAANHLVGVDGTRPTPTTLWADDFIFSGLFGVTGIGQLNHSFNFDTKTYTATSGNFTMPIPDLPGVPLPGSLVINYAIQDLDGDSVDDIRMLITEIPHASNPTQTFSAVLNAADWSGNKDGRINGTFAVGVELKAVPEPASIALFGLGLAGLAMRRRKKQA